MCGMWFRCSEWFSHRPWRQVMVQVADVCVLLTQLHRGMYERVVDHGLSVVSLFTVVSIALWLNQFLDSLSPFLILTCIDRCLYFSVFFFFSLSLSSFPCFLSLSFSCNIYLFLLLGSAVLSVPASFYLKGYRGGQNGGSLCWKLRAIRFLPLRLE